MIAEPSRWQRRIAKFWQDISRWGVLRALHMWVMPRLASVLQVSYALTRPLGHRQAVHSHAGCSIRIVTLQDLEAASAERGMDLDPEAFRRAIDRGDICVGAFDGDRLVAYTWRAFQTAPHNNGLWVQFRPPFRYGYKALTLPAYRGLHLQEAMAPLLDEMSIRRGYTHAISFIETHNHPSLRMSLRSGNRIVGLIGYVRVFGRYFPFRSRGAANLGFGFSPRKDSTSTTPGNRP